MLTLPNTQRRALVAAIVGVGGLLAGVKMKLYSNIVAPSPHSLFADFTEATYDGYVESAAVTWGAVYTDPGNNATVYASKEEFPCTGSTVSEAIYGYYLVDGATSLVLIGAEAFTLPVAVAGVGDGVVVETFFSFGQ